MAPSATPDSRDDGHLTFSDWLSGILLRWRVILWSIAMTFIAAGAAVLIIKPRYEAEASFLVNGASSGKGFAGGGGLAGLAGQLGIGGGESSESPAFYKELLQSRELLTRLLHSRFPDPRTDVATDSVQLIDLIGISQKEPRDRLERAVKKIKRRVVPETNVKTALVRVFATTQWPELSAQVDNRAMELVNVFNREQRTSRARAKRLYLQRRMDSALVQLRSAEARRQVFLSGNRKISPALQLSDDQLKRAIDIARDDYQSLQKQFDTAELDELDDAPLITIVDLAVPPARATWPRVEWIIAGCLFVGIVIGVTIAGALVVRDAWAARNPAAANRLSHAWNAAKGGITRRGKQRPERQQGA
jgi:uncharacterized protein involved in exopolysaccharide biosynthesis